MLFTSQVGYYFVYTIQQHILKEEIKKEMLAHIPDSSLEVFVQEDLGNKIEWEEDEKEFFLDGALYDVARIKKEDGKTYLYCINDRKEKMLLDNLAKAINKNHDNKRNRNLKPALADLISIVPMEPPVFFSVSSQYIPFTTPLVVSFKESNSPPPRA